MFSKLKSKKEQIDAIETNDLEPVDKKDIENVIKLIETAHNTNAEFRLKLILSIGDFVVDEDSFDGIKLVSNKQNGDRLLIKHKNILLANETFIELGHIKCINFNLKYNTGER